jgi:hypothetical protein
MKRVNLKKILGDPVLRRKLMIACIIATQAREGITTTYEQAVRAYDQTCLQSRKLEGGQHGRQEEVPED